MGVKTGEAIWEAKIKCPDLITVPPNYEDYLRYSLWARDLLLLYTNQVEPLVWMKLLDVTGSKKILGQPNEIAQAIRMRMKKELGITVSIGVSFNKIFAKIGSI